MSQQDKIDEFAGHTPEPWYVDVNQPKFKRALRVQLQKESKPWAK